MVMILFAVQRPCTQKPFDGEYETKHFTPTTPSSYRPKTLKFNNIRSDPLEHALNEVSFSKMHTRLNI